MFFKSLFRALLLGVFLVVFSQTSFAAAKGKPKDPTRPVYETPVPGRSVVLRPVASKAFDLPNGSRVSIGADLDSMLNTVGTGSTQFKPADALAPRPCDSHLELRAAVTTMQLEVAQFGLKFGWTPGGSLDFIESVKVKSKVTVGTIAMDFSLWECVGGKCTAVAAVTADHLTAGVEMDFDVDFGAITIGPGFVYNTPLGSILRKIMVKGVEKLSQSARLNELTWFALVKEYYPETGAVLFDQGSQSRLKNNQTFTVYSVTPSAGVCEVYRPAAYIHTTRVDTVSSYGQIDQVFGDQPIRPGDVVMVRRAE